MNIYTSVKGPEGKKIYHVKEINGKSILFQIYPGLPKAVKDIKR